METKRNWVWSRTLLFTLLVPGSVAGWAPWLLARGDAGALGAWLGAWRWLGVAAFVPGILIYAWCAWDFTFTGRGTPAPNDPPRALVGVGLYRFSRNPMYVGVLLTILGEGVLYGSWRVLAYAVAVALGFHAWVLWYEEPVLDRLFGEKYAEYRARVPRWF